MRSAVRSELRKMHAKKLPLVHSYLHALATFIQHAPSYSHGVKASTLGTTSHPAGIDMIDDENVNIQVYLNLKDQPHPLASSLAVNIGFTKKRVPNLNLISFRI